MTRILTNEIACGIKEGISVHKFYPVKCLPPFATLRNPHSHNEPIRNRVTWSSTLLKKSSRNRSSTRSIFRLAGRSLARFPKNFKFLLSAKVSVHLAYEYLIFKSSTSVHVSYHWLTDYYIIKLIASKFVSYPSLYINCNRNKLNLRYIL